MGTRLENLRHRAVDIVDDKSVIEKAEQANASDLSMIKTLLDKEFQDDDVLSSFQKLNESLREDGNSIESEKETNRTETDYALSDVDEYVAALKQNLSRMNEIEKTTDLSKRTGFETQSTEQRIEELDAIKKLLMDGDFSEDLPAEDKGGFTAESPRTVDSSVLDAVDQNAISAKISENTDPIEKTPKFSDNLKQSYHSSVSNKISAASSVDELVKTIKEEQIARNAYFGKLDLQSAKALTQTVYSAVNDMGLKDVLGCLPIIGTTSGAFAAIRERMKAELEKAYHARYPEKPISSFEDDIQYQIEDYMTSKFGLSNDVLAISVSFSQHEDFDVSQERILQSGEVTLAIGDNTVSHSFNGILINAQTNDDLKEIKRKLVSGATSGQSPKECDSFKYLIVHELTHQADNKLKISQDLEIKKMYDSFVGSDSATQIDSLCSYAKTNVHEFVAEAYAEAICSQNPRQMALDVKKRVDELANGFRNASEWFNRERER